MKILISNSSDLPLYQQIKDQLKDAILQGDLKDGDSMPSICLLYTSDAADE